MRHAGFSILILFILSSCRTGNSPTNAPPPPQRDRGVFILNEGAFPNAGSISYYNITKDSVIQTVVGTSAGWIVPNDAKVVGNKLYVAVNGNDRIEILDAETFRSLGSILLPSGSGPGYISIVDSTRALVANYNGTVSSLNLASNAVMQTTAPLFGFPGAIVVGSGKVFVSDYGLFPNFKDLILVLEGATLTVVDTIRVSVAAGSMVAGGADRLYLVSTGNFPSNGKVYAINTQTNAVVDSVVVGVGPGDIAIVNQTLYVLHSDRVMKLSASPLSIIDSTFASLSSGLFFYALQVDAVTGDLYLSKVIATGGSGQVEIYDPSKTLKRQPFAVGSFPGAIVFR